jgi:hypothetical protein
MSWLTRAEQEPGSVAGAFGADDYVVGLARRCERNLAGSLCRTSKLTAQCSTETVTDGRVAAQVLSCGLLADVPGRGSVPAGRAVGGAWRFAASGAMACTTLNTCSFEPTERTFTITDADVPIHTVWEFDGRAAAEIYAGAVGCRPDEMGSAVSCPTRLV